MADETKGEKAEQKPVEPAKIEEATPKAEVEKKIEPAQAPVESEKKTEEPQVTAETEKIAVGAEPQTPAGEEKKAAPAAMVKVERPANCVVCNKSIKLRKRWYYRNGKYYCTKRCWRTTVKKEEEKPQDAKASG